MGQCSSAKGKTLSAESAPQASFPFWDVDVPSFSMLGPCLSDVQLKTFRNIQMGNDESMNIKGNTAKRDKAIRFVMVSEGRCIPLSQDYFVQEVGYNDFSGGYKRFYASIDDETVSCLLPVVMTFMRHFRLPEKTIFLMQIQTTTFRKMAVRNSVTGQGIHTDGADRAMIVCLERGPGVDGAENQFHGALNGSKPLCEPTVLPPGHAAAWKDNEIYHYVTPGEAKPGFEPKDTKRTMLLMHGPAEMFLWGIENPHNTLGANESAIKIRTDINETSAST